MNLFNKAIAFAKSYCDISENDITIIMHARKNLVFYDKQLWTKKSYNNDFDVPMGCFDGAEVCELVGTYLLNQLPHLFDKKFIGLYRNDGVGIIKNKSGPEIESIKKALTKTLNDHELQITVEANIEVLIFLISPLI